MLLDDQLGEMLTQGEPGGAEPEHSAVDLLVLRQILLAGAEDVARFEKYETDSVGRVTGYFADGVKSVVRQLYGTIPLTARTIRLFDEHLSGIFTATGGQDGTFAGVARAVPRATGAGRRPPRSRLAAGARRGLLACSCLRSPRMVRRGGSGLGVRTPHGSPGPARRFTR
ncbi:hypothetical protein [Amycolatopsis sp.]|uniref:hypothetical protein n=1 Tax=Amycolatopsis sp. TaxID=37632 RepID=UPI002C851162|nr:hypothetical protein [Amycolatopsis sp.]HVV07902.1 hypothetical protein [Amycolatopsis sp.]